MARDLFRIEKGIHIVGENLDVGVQILFGNPLPTGAIADAAEIGSMYHRENGEIYHKIGATTWDRAATVQDLNAIKWRNEQVRAITGEVLVAGSKDLLASPFTDDEGTKLSASDFSVGMFVIGGYGSSPLLFEVTNVAGDNITLVLETVNVLAAGDQFVVDAFLPDSPNDQELAALINFNGSEIIKISDVNWSLADGINLTAGYVAASADVLANATIEDAIAAIDGNVDAIDSRMGSNQGDTNMGTYAGSSILLSNLSVKQNIAALGSNVEALQTLSGVSAGAVDLGTFAGNIIDSNTDIHNALEQLEAGVEEIAVRSEALAVTSYVTLDEVLVDSVFGCGWDIQASLDSAPSRCKMMSLNSMHNGTSVADANDLDDVVFAKLKLGSTFTTDILIDLNGTGAAQTMRLRVSAPQAVSFRATRRAIK